MTRNTKFSVCNAGFSYFYAKSKYSLNKIYVGMYVCMYVYNTHIYVYLCLQYLIYYRFMQKNVSKIILKVCHC